MKSAVKVVKKYQINEFRACKFNAFWLHPTSNWGGEHISLRASLSTKKKEARESSGGQHEEEKNGGRGVGVLHKVIIRCKMEEDPVEMQKGAEVKEGREGVYMRGRQKT